MFIDNELSIRLGEDKTKYILNEKETKQYPTLNITRSNNKIKQYSIIEYLGCLLDENMSGESMAKRALKKLMEKQNFFLGRIGTYHTLLDGKTNKKGNKRYPALNITRNDNKIKQYSVVEYLACLLDENMSGESMAKRALKKLMEKQNFFIGRIDTYHTLLKECYATPSYDHILILHVVLGIQTCRCH